MSYGCFSRRAAVRRRRGSIMTRIAVGLSPLWLGALFLTFENTSGRADKPLSTEMASAGAGEVAPAPKPLPAIAVFTAETPPTPVRTLDQTRPEDRIPRQYRAEADGEEPVRDAADGHPLAQRTPEKLDTLPQTDWDKSVAATVPQPTWLPKPRPPHFARSSPDEESTAEPAAETLAVSAVSGIPEVDDPVDRWKYPPEPADPGGQEAPAERMAAWEDLLAPPASSLLTEARVVIHEPRGGVSTGARDLLSMLRTRGVGVAEIRNVGASVSQPDIRFFHERDRALAEQVDRMLSRQGYRPAVKDFTHYQQTPSRGTVEVWLPG